MKALLFILFLPITLPLYLILGFLKLLGLGSVVLDIFDL